MTVRLRFVLDGYRKLTITSTCFLLATIALWEASYVDVQYGRGAFRFELEEGRLGFVFLPNGDAMCPVTYKWYHERTPHGWSVGGFYGWDTDLAPGFAWLPNLKYVQIPFWPLCVLFLVLPIHSLYITHRRQWRKCRGKCQDCGYNLHGLPEPRCPECGTPFDPASLPAEKKGPSDSHPGP